MRSTRRGHRTAPRSRSTRCTSGAYNIWTIEPDGTDLTQLTHRTSGSDNSPTWSREGRRDRLRERPRRPQRRQPALHDEPRRHRDPEAHAAPPVARPEQRPGVLPRWWSDRVPGRAQRRPRDLPHALERRQRHRAHDHESARLRAGLAARHPPVRDRRPLSAPQGRDAGGDPISCPPFASCKAPNRVHGPATGRAVVRAPAQYSSGAHDRRGRRERPADSRSGVRADRRHPRQSGHNRRRGRRLDPARDARRLPPQRPLRLCRRDRPAHDGPHHRPRQLPGDRQRRRRNGRGHDLQGSRFLCADRRRGHGCVMHASTRRSTRSRPAP